jgi:hypothetical protein
VLHLKYAGWSTLFSAHIALQLSEAGITPNLGDPYPDIVYGVVVAKEPAKENLLQILEKHKWSQVWTRQCACVYTIRLCALGKVAFLSVVSGNQEKLWVGFNDRTVLQWLRLISSLTTLIIDLRENVDSFRSYLGFTPHVEPCVGSFPALQNLHLPLGHAPIDSIYIYSQIVVNLPTIFSGLKSFRMDEWVEGFWRLDWYPSEGMLVSDDRAEPLIWPGLESLTLGKIESAGEVRTRWIPGTMNYTSYHGRRMLWAVDPNKEEGTDVADVVHTLPKFQLPNLRRLSLVGVMLRQSDLGWVPDVLKMFPSLDVMEGEVLNSREPRSPCLDPELNEYGAYEQRVSVDDPNIQEPQEDRLSFQKFQAALGDTWWLTVDEVWPGKVRPGTFKSSCSNVAAVCTPKKQVMSNISKVCDRSRCRYLGLRQWTW